jgi:hypothetical protein
MTDHSFDGVDCDVHQRARDHWRPMDRLGSTDDEEPEHDTIILAW